MFDTTILLAEPLEQGPLTAALLRHNPRLAVDAVSTRAELDAIEPRLLKRARLVAFATNVIVPAALLNRLGFGAYNFHPGPPYYPGWAPSHFAIYDRATTFGVTAHVMHERVDSGPIVAIDLFDVPAGMSGEALEAMTYGRLLQQFFALAEALATNDGALPALPVQWCGRKNTHRRAAELCEITADISRDELERRMAAFGDGRLGMTPAITLHGRQFRLVTPESATTGPAVAPPLVPSTPAAVPATTPA